MQYGAYAVTRITHFACNFTIIGVNLWWALLYAVETGAPFTQPGRGGNVALLFRLAHLYKTYKYRLGEGIVVKSPAEVVTEPNRLLYKMGEPTERDT